jgi:flagellar M-ring protein FliF
LAILKELVASAVGLNPDRGDVLTLKSLPFQQPAAQGTLAESDIAPIFGQIDLLSVLQLAVLAIVALVMGLFVLRPILLSSSRAVPRLAASALPLALPRTMANGQVLTGEIDDGTVGAQNAIKAHALPDASGEAVARLRLLIEDRQAESIEILRSWMEFDEEAA